LEAGSAMKGRFGQVRHCATVALLALAAGVLSGCAWFEPRRYYSIKDTPAAAGPTRTAVPRTRVTATAPAAGQPAASAPAPANQPQRMQSATVAATAGCRDAAACDGLLRTLVEGRDRSWILGPPTPQAHVSGVRMFAYRALRPRLTCGELAVGIEEMRSVPNALATKPAGTTTGDVERALDLAARVQEELRTERESRCRTAPAPDQPQPQPPPASPAPRSGAVQPPPAAAAAPASPAAAAPPSAGAATADPPPATAGAAGAVPASPPATPPPDAAKQEPRQEPTPKQQ
jgi:hypothetical protein